MKKINKNLIFISILILFWLSLTLIYIFNSDLGLTVLSYNEGKESFNNLTYKKLYKGDKITGEFKAHEDNLGIISIRFKTSIKPPYDKEDLIVFRIKERGITKWYYENTYKDGLIFNYPFYPFGFPPIQNSKNKYYDFEIESLNGNSINAVSISDKNQTLFSRYQIPKSVILHDKKSLLDFLVKKFLSAILTTDIRFSSFVYSLPLIFYILWGTRVKRYTIIPLRRRLNFLTEFIVNSAFFNKISPFLWPLKSVSLSISDCLIILTTVIDIFIIQINNDLIYIVAMGLWIVTLKANNFESKKPFIFAIILLIIPPIFLNFGDVQTAEKAALWSFAFLVAGTVQILIEEIRNWYKIKSRYRF